MIYGRKSERLSESRPSVGNTERSSKRRDSIGRVKKSEAWVGSGTTKILQQH